MAEKHWSNTPEGREAYRQQETPAWSGWRTLALILLIWQPVQLLAPFTELRNRGEALEYFGLGVLSMTGVALAVTIIESIIDSLRKDKGDY